MVVSLVMYLLKKLFWKEAPASTPAEAAGGKFSFSGDGSGDEKIDSIQWPMFVNYRLNPETQERCRKNKENRRKQVIPHTGGSKPLSRKRHEMEQIEVGLTQSNVDESVISPNDVVGRVLGPEHPGRVRCMGKYTNLEAAFKAYLMMKEGEIPREVADILGLWNGSGSALLISVNSCVCYGLLILVLSFEVDQDKHNKGTNLNASVISDEETPVQKNNKRPNEAGSQTPVSAKKAKNAFPGKTDGKNGVHIVTPHPKKKGGKTPQNVAMDQIPSSSKPGLKSPSKVAVDILH
ncbi:hypothetical protein TSUD_285380 [Trifolium subterraneum]|uniref:Uncharacterized protein n=1 Tax=Trifolium subterraneum TaxID=3900 RepID=A0A2Z6PPU0_TRISU|nr:hypothetical protein TSUD_285380 [Trifolium subterraneum]